MFEFALGFEQSAKEFSPAMLLGPGLAAVLAGLFAWLGGLGFRGILAGLFGAAAAALMVYFTARPGWPITAAVSLAGCITALILEHFLPAAAGLWRFLNAVLLAATGSAMLFAGMVLLLLYKGTPAVSYINDRPAFFTGVFLAMTAFGAIIQLVFCPSDRKKLKTQKNIQEK